MSQLFCSHGGNTGSVENQCEDKPFLRREKSFDINSKTDLKNVFKVIKGVKKLSVM